MAAALPFPCTIFTTQKQMDDYGANDMLCGDLPETQLILNDTSKNSTLTLIKNTLEYYIDWVDRYFPLEQQKELSKTILDGKLPKFDRFQDSFNGMGITVHDTWATHITIRSLHIDNKCYRAVVHYKVQDHFGLDSSDILKFSFSQFRFFRIWFVLQRYNQFGFRPFMTNM
ncbi:hypothetical protein COO59_15450 [Mixta theicola]|uniref:DUF3289 domain-containing protein n=1 Tax=Mixta theicola TaxID=1458355 RepID=A0A2K1Q6S6_9GAMM|nr:YPO3983 family protein [Mixta theicola]PNS10746.1 hypothetical protein COO59_15450 [Mixta theicola]GLR08887.1 hypothetical protein GCM10007905_16060 [Mixta theicola]